MAGTDISNKHFNIIDGINLMMAYKGKCNIVPCHLTSQALDYCIGRINPPKDLMVLDTSLDLPYDFSLNEEKVVNTLNKDFKFATDKFGRVSGEMVDLVLSLTKKAHTNQKYPTYCFDVVLHETKDVIGNINLSIVPNNIDEHSDNVKMNFKKGYDLKSVKYECCKLIRKVAQHHKLKSLYLNCPPDDMDTRVVFESLGAYLKEIKTFTYTDENNKRKTYEQCIWVWEIE